MTRKTNTLGSLVRALRRQKSWTLRQMSEPVGIPPSTLAKVEQDKLSLTYDKLQQLTARVGLTMAEFLAQADPPKVDEPKVVTARRSLTRDGNSVQVSTPNYDYEYLCADLREKRMLPILTRIRAHDIKEFGEPVRHQGEEFVLGHDDYELPSIPETIDLNLRLGKRTNPAIRCGGVRLNTAHLEPAAARELMAQESARLGLPVADPMRPDAYFERLIDSCLA